MNSLPAHRRAASIWQLQQGHELLVQGIMWQGALRRSQCASVERRRMFEHFGSLKSAVHSAGDGRPGDALLDVEGGDKRMAVDPQYTIPKVRRSRISRMAMDTHHTKRSGPEVLLLLSAVWHGAVDRDECAHQQGVHRRGSHTLLCHGLGAGDLPVPLCACTATKVVAAFALHCVHLLWQGLLHLT